MAELPERVLFCTVSVLKLLMLMPPPLLAELPERVLFCTVSAPRFKMPPPRPTGKPPLASPPLTVALFRVRLAPPATARMRKAVALLRLIVLPLPSMVIALAITGRPLLPSVVLFTAVRVTFVCRSMMSAPLPAVQPPAAASVLAAVMASASVHVTPSTLMVAAGPIAPAGAPFTASSSAISARLRLSWRCQRRRSVRGRQRSRPYQAAKRPNRSSLGRRSAPLRAGVAGTSARACCQAANASGRWTSVVLYSINRLHLHYDMTFKQSHKSQTITRPTPYRRC